MTCDKNFEQAYKICPDVTCDKKFEQACETRTDLNVEGNVETLADFKRVLASPLRSFSEM